MSRFVLVFAVAASTAPAAAATLRDARLTVAFAPGGCDVTSRFVVDTADPAVVEHRLMVSSGAVPEFAVVGGIAGRADLIARSARLPVSLTGSGRNEYSVRYHASVDEAADGRCPLLVPHVPTDGVARSVLITADVPDDAAVLPGGFPAFDWRDRRGTVRISHIPSFVRVRYAPRGAAIAWHDTLDPARVVDVLAVSAIGISTLGWVLLRRRRT
jgi:hypothetical protein